MATTKLNHTELTSEINRLKKQKNAVVLAHYYQDAAIQDVADFVGDSLGLSQQAAKTNAAVIVFAGVRFMAETAKILNPGKKVILPDLNAGCSLEESCPPEAFDKFVKQHPQHVVVTYINCSAEVKALSDIICTSSNAVDVINSIPKNQPIIFAPDKNLGTYLMKQTQRELVLWNGACIVHEAFSIDKILQLSGAHPSAKIIAHPESEEHVLKVAHFIGSTAAMIKYVKEDDHKTYIVATEAGILHQMKKEAPHKELIAAPVVADNTCSCSECAFMKLNTLEKLYWCMVKESPEIQIAENIRQRALIPIQRMLDLSEKKNIAALAST